MKTFFAHLHPLLVHLPIGILLLAVVFSWMGRQKHYAKLQESLPILMRLGAIAAFVSCCSGWLLGNSGEYDATWHQWFGIATTAAAILACFAPKNIWVSTTMAVLLIITGHLGGSMTHGEGYITFSAFSSDAPGKSRPADAQEAQLYAEIIAPIFQEKCLSCHNSRKQKGGLRLDHPDHILKGGKGGIVFNPGVPDGGELMRRCLLPLGHEDHMPPKEKPQLSPEELEILKWWIAQGADFQKKTKDFPQTEMVRKSLGTWLKISVTGAPIIPDVPEMEPPAASQQALEKLRQSGIHILPVSQESHWLSVNFVNRSNPPDSFFLLLEKIAEQTVWLNLNHCKVPENAWPSIGKLTNLTKLSLDHSSVNDAAMVHLKNLRALQYLNLSQTEVTGSSLHELTGMKNLQQLFLFQVNRTTTDIAALRAALPHLKIDTGAYVLPFLESDTARLIEEKTY